MITANYEILCEIRGLALGDEVTKARKARELRADPVRISKYASELGVKRSATNVLAMAERFAENVPVG